MAKLIKIILFTVLGFIALFITAAVVLVATVDPNEYKSEIAMEVKKATGRDLMFEGDIEFKFFPWLGLKVGPVALGNRSGFTPEEMLRINKAEASLNIMPLFSGNVSVGKMILDGFTLNLVINKKGVNNWDDLAEKGKTPTAPQDAQPSGQSPTPEEIMERSGLKSINIGGVEITNANIVFDDRQTGKRSSVTELNLIVGEMADKITTPIEMTFTLMLNDPVIETRPNLKAMLTADKDAGTIQLTDFIFTFMNTTTTGNFFAKYKDGELNYSGELNTAEMSPRELMGQLGMVAPETTDPEVLTRFSSALRVDGNAKNVMLEQLTIRLDDITISGNGSVTDFANPSIMVATNIDKIDIDKYLPPAMSSDNAETPTEPLPESQDGPPAEEPDLTGLKELNLQSRLTIGEIKVMNLHVSEILCEMVIKGGVISVKPFKAQLYEGEIESEALMDVRKKVAVWRETATMQGVQIGPLVKDYTGSDRITGSAQLKYDLRGKGLLPDNIKNSLTGNLAFAVRNGVVYGININKMLEDGINKILLRPESEDEPAQTDFAEITGSAVITKGNIDNRDLILKNPLIRVNGEGWADLPSNQVDYKATATVVSSLKGQGGESMDELYGIPVPVYIRGNMDDPSISLDMKALGKMIMESKYKKKAEDLTDDYTDDAKGFTDKMKKKLFGSDEVDENGEKKEKGLLDSFF